MSIERPCFVDIRNCGGNEEDGDIDPIGGFSYNTVIGIEYDGNQHKTKDDFSQLHTPKIFSVFEEKALDDGKDKHWPKE